MKKILVFIFSALMVACCKCDCPTTPAENKPEEIQEYTYYLKKPFLYDNNEYVFSSVKTASLIKTKNNENLIPKNKFLIIDLSIKNAGKVAISLPQLKLIDEEGRVFEQLEFMKTYWIKNYFFLEPLKKLNPLDSFGGVIVFDVPENGNYSVLLSETFEDVKHKVQLKEQAK